MAKGTIKTDPEALERALSLYTVSTESTGSQKETLFLQAASELLGAVGSIEPHKQELMSILSGEHGDATPASLALFAVTILRTYPKLPPKEQAVLDEFVGKIEDSWNS